MSTTTTVTSPRRSRRPLVNTIIWLHGASSFCLGLVYPYTSIYLSDRPAIGTGGVALYYGLSGIANLVAALVLALGLIRPPRTALGVVGNLLSCAGYIILSTVHTPGEVAVAGIANGAGQGCFLAAIIPIVNALVTEGERRRTFAFRYQVLNGTLAAGSLVAGLLTAVFSRDAIHYLMIANAVGYIPIALTLAITGRISSRAAAAARAGESPAPTELPMPVGALIKAALTVALFQMGMYLFGFSQFEATMPLTADRLMHQGLTFISVLISINVIVIVLAQPVMTRLLERRSEVFGLRVGVALWVTGYLLVGILSVARSPLPMVGLVAFATLFALGECAYSCSYHPWLISRVPDKDLTRANALSNSMMGVGLFAGPTIGVALVTTGSVVAVWLVLGALCTLVTLTTIRRRLPALAPETTA
jgi:MFS family permease